jgi:hypothetical protein
VISLVEFSNFVLSKMEDGLQVDAVYTDFSIGFDRVNDVDSKPVMSKSARMLEFIKRISREFTYKTLYVAFVRPGLEYASCMCSPHQEVHSARIERNFIKFALRDLDWTVQPLPSYESRLLELEVLSDRR